MPDIPSQLLNRPFRFYIRRHWRQVVLGLSCLFLTNLGETMVPWLVGKCIDQITAAATLKVVGHTVLWIFMVIAVMSVFRFLWRIFWASFHHTVAEDLRNRLFARMSVLGPGFFRPRKVGQLISLISNDVNSFRMGLGPGLLILFDGIFLVGLILPVMISISWTWTWQTLLLMPFVPFAVRAMLGSLHKAYHARQDRFADMAGSAQEIISGIRVIKSFAQEKNQTGQFNRHSDVFMQSCNRVAWWDALFGPVLELPVALGSVLLLLLGAGPVMAGHVSLGQFFAFYQYILRLIWPMSGIGIAIGRVQEGRAAFRRIREVFDFPQDVVDDGDVEVHELKSLEVRNLSFRYPGASVKSLDGVSFRLEKGESLGIVGMTGSGKSTLIELLTRQYPVEPNTIFVNDIPIERIRLSSLRQMIAVVPQEAFLFSRQVDENLALGTEIWDIDDVREAAGQVRIQDEIENWPGGYQALVGERGVNLSGGQKQRMTLARALMREAPLVILDDSLSAVDAKTETAILRLLRGTLRKTTSIVVSHRLASVKHADHILVLNAGEMESFGRHEDLIEHSSIYRSLNSMQTEAVEE